MRLRLYPLVLAVAAVFLSTSVQAANIHGELTTAEVTHDGPTMTTGSLAALLIDPDANAGLADAHFSLEATDLSVVRDHTDAYADPFTIAPVQSTPEHEGPGAMHGIRNRDGHVLWVLPLDTTEAPKLALHEQHSSTLSPSTRDETTRAPAVDVNRPAFTLDTTTTIAWDSANPTIATIRGDFLMVLWEWDAALTADGSTRELQTGVQDRTGAQTVGSADELFITARDATLTLRLTPETHTTLLANAHVKALALTFHDAHGTLDGLTSPIRGDATLTGTLAVDLAGTDTNRPLRAAVSGDVQEASLNGKELVIQVPQAPGSSDTGTAWALSALLALPLLAWASWPNILYRVARIRGADMGDVLPKGWQERRATGRWIAGHHALQRGHLARAERLLEPCLDARPHFPDALVTLGTLHAIHGEQDKAASSFQAAFMLFRSPRRRAVAALANAEVHLGREGQEPLVVEWLRNARHADAELTRIHVRDARWDRLEAYAPRLLRHLRNLPDRDDPMIH